MTAMITRLRRATPLLAIAMALSSQVPAPAAYGAAPITMGAQARFQDFFAKFRKAVLAGDREAVAGMTRFPFVDYRAGYFCELGDRACTVPADALTSADKAAFLARYDLIFTPEVIAAIRDGKVRGFIRGSDDGEAPGPIEADEYLLDAANTDAQRVFSLQGGVYRMSRVPFYS